MTANAKVSGAGTASAGLPGYAGDNNGEKKMLTKYKIKGRWPEAKIEEVEVLRETAQCIFVSTNKTKSNPNGERKELKMTEWSEYYDTWDAAHAALTDKAARQVTNARLALEIANSFAGNVKGMRHNAEVTGA